MATSSSKSSFLNLVLEGCQAVEKEELTALISKLGSEMSDLKTRVKEVIDDTYVNFTKLAQEHRYLLLKAKSLTSEIDDLSSKVTNHTTRSLKASTSELQELSASMQEVSLITIIVNQLLNFDIAFQSISKLRVKKEYCGMAKALINIRAMLEEPTNKSNDLEIYHALAVEYSLQIDSFMDEMAVIWRECIKFGEELSENTPHLQLFTLKVDINRFDEISQMFQALNHLDHLNLYFERFEEWLLQSMLIPIMKRGAYATIEQNEKYAVLIVNVEPSGQQHPHKKVFENLLKVLNFIHSHMEINIEDGVTLLNKLGATIGDEFCNVLVEHCLSATIPSHSSELDDYKAVVADIADFQSQLIKMGFLDENYQPLLDYTGNVEYLCANKTCRTLLEKARKIMKKDLYDMMEVGGEPDSIEEAQPSVELEDISAIKPEIRLSKNTMRFPKCQISKSASELLNLINQVLVDCAASTDMCAVRLFYTARNIVELYCAVVPMHHQKLLETIPQQVALFHNNCMFLSHRLLILGHEHHSLLPEVLKEHLVTFVDQVTELRTIGTKIFLEHMHTQQKQILDIIRNCGLATLGESSNLTLGTEKALRQCLRQLELLQSVWQPVLPNNIYCKAMGCLVNAFIDELIMRVVKLEDIPKDTATQLLEMFKIVSERIPKVFQEPKEIHRHVEKWEMFCELMFILGATMRDISDRWANGKGPLALLFQPEQVKQLVRALFQNTERRSAVLAGIKKCK